MDITIYDQFKATELRKAARMFIPGAGSRGGLAHVGKMQEIKAALFAAGITAEEIKSSNSGELPIEEQPFELQAEEIQPQPDQSKAIELAKAIMNITGDMRPATAGMTEEDRKRIKELENRIKELESRPPQVHEVKTEYDTVKIEGILHQEFDTILRTVGAGVNCLLVGPAGSGKTTCAKQVADALGLRFAALSVGEETSKSDLLGYMDANGVYHATPTVREMFQNGGVLLLDELDAGNANVITILNALLSNGYCSFPDGMVARHKDFRCIASANTFGRGADRMYVGRNALDAATLNRFNVVEYNYDENMEMQLAQNKDWCAKVQKYRKNAENLKLRIIISPRATLDGEKLIAAGIPEEKVEEMAIFKGCDEGMKSKIKYGY